MNKKICAISVDLDPLTAYYDIHGLGDPPPQLRYTILRKALPRLEALFAELNVPVTFFVVGRELEQSEDARTVLVKLAQAGHELANHTYSHPYDLCRLPEQVIDAEIRQAQRAIINAVGEELAPVGFRTPGYFVNAKVLQVLANHGYSYDSSMFPSPPYFLAKVAVMAGMSLRGRRSGSIIADPRLLFSPADPYRPDPLQPWKRGQSPVVELPVAVLPWTRVPAIGTFLAVSPAWMRRYFLSAIRKRPFFNLELHGIDLADAIADRIPTELAGRQPDLRVPFAEKRRIFADTIESLKQDYDFMTLKDVAAIAQREEIR